jgi:tetratricopeptide (TPR) repeat protein
MKSRAALSWFATLVVALGLPGRAWSATNLEVPIGPRAIGMGGAFSAIADDATAPYWNAAGLPSIGHQEISASHADLFSSGILNDYASFVLPLSRSQAAALDFYHSGFNDPELNFGETRVDLAYGQRILSAFSAGASLKYLGRHTDLDGITVRQGAGVGLDLGLLATPYSWLRLAGVVQDVFNTKLTYSQGDGTVTAYPRVLRIGAAWTPLRRGTLACDLDDHVHIGAEYAPIEPVSLRAGMQTDPSGLDGQTYSFGIGLRWSTLRFDYALEDHSTLGVTSHFGLSMGFNFNPSQVRIERVAVNDIYTSLYRSYTTNSFGSVRVKNLEGEPLNTRVRVMVPGWMREPSEQEVVLRPHATQELPLTAVLPDAVMSLSGDRAVQVEVTASYQSLRLPRTERASARCTAYGPGAIDWSQGLGQAAAWVTTRDPVVESVAREAVRVAAQDSASLGHVRSLDFAASIFDAVESLGLSYVPDPNNPYSTISGQAKAVDTIYYPRETLARLAGDCDDMSVLFAALFGNVGIRTQFVGVPGHIFLLVGTDVHVRDRLALGVDDAMLVVDHDEIWIPLETTALGKGFTAAWQSGAEGYSSWIQRGRVELADVSGSQLKYEQGVLGGTPAVPQLDVAKIEARLSEDRRTLAIWRSAFIASRFAGVRDSLVASDEALNQMARLYFLAGQTSEAADALARALAASPSSARTLNNLAVVEAAGGDLERSSAQLRDVVTIDPADAGPWLNLGLVRDAAGDSTAAGDALDRGIALSGGYAGACTMLGIAPEEQGVNLEGTQRMTAEEARALLKAAVRRVPHAPASAPSPAPATAKPRPWTSRTAGGRSSDRTALADLLYWKN